MKTTVHLAVASVLAEAAKRQASDAHFQAGSPPMLRLDQGLAASSRGNVVTKDWLEDLRDELLSEPQREELERRRSVRLVLVFEGKSRVRVSAFYQQGGLAFTLRPVPTVIPTLAALGLPPSLSQITRWSRGLVVIAGPYNSGRSTTVAAMLQHVNQQRAENILTIEQPIEYLLQPAKSLVVQREVGRDVPTFRQALEECAHEDITVVMVGETNEVGVLWAAVELAAVGRLVYAIADASTVVAAVEKIFSACPPARRSAAPAVVASCLRAVVAQRLVSRLGGGRVAAVEIMTATPATRALFREGRLEQLQSVLQTSQQEGMVSLDQSLAALVKNGTVAVAAALAEAVDPEHLAGVIRGYG